MMSFSDADIRALVKAGQYSDPKDAETLAQTLIERRDIIARYWFSKCAPLDQFAFSNGRLTFKDLAVEAGFKKREEVLYRAVIMTAGEKPRKLSELEAREPSFLIPAEAWGEKGDLKIEIRVVSDPLKKTEPSVTVVLNAAGVQGIQHEA